MYNMPETRTLRRHDIVTCCRLFSIAERSDSLQVKGPPTRISSLQPRVPYGRLCVTNNRRKASVRRASATCAIYESDVGSV